MVYLDFGAYALQHQPGRLDQGKRLGRVWHPLSTRQVACKEAVKTPNKDLNNLCSGKSEWCIFFVCVCYDEFDENVESRGDG